MISELFTQLLGGQSSDDKAKLQALDQSQAVIEFNMDGTIISANDNFLNAMGYSLSEIKGQHHKMFVTNDLASSREYQAFWDKLNQGEFQSAEFPRVNKKGEVIWIQATYNPLRDKKREFIQSRQICNRYHLSEKNRCRSSRSIRCHQ